jgi:hypothetical protein
MGAGQAKMPRMKRFLGSVAALMLLVAGCGDSGTEETNETTPPVPNLKAASGVTITEVAIYQSVKRQLAKDGAAVTSDVPLVAGRDAMIRVFYTTSGDYDGKAVTGRLSLGDDGDPIDVEQVLSEPTSSDGSISSTLNFFIPGDRIGAELNYSVEVLQLDAAGTNKAARYPVSGAEKVVVDAQKQVLRVVIAPFRYDFDGSGRLPDTSETAVEAYRNRLKQLFPVSDVEVTVRGATPWNRRIGPEGNGWNEVLMEVYQYRAFDNASDDVYYYALFNPANSFNQYCGGGCVLGLSLLNDQPAATGEVEFRFAAGVGYDPYAYDTTAHELGHAHGRRHAPCGPGLDPQSIDNQFPYSDGTIGAWGLDVATTQLFSPTATTDVMGYCDFTWISDYNYKALLNRGSGINLPKWHQAPRERALVVSVDGAGGASWGTLGTIPTNLAGTRVPAKVRELGQQRSASARFLSFDHLPGGLAIIPGVTEDVSEVELTIDNKVVRVSRPAH